MSRFAAPIAEQIWDMKYRLKDAEGQAIDGSVEDSWRRVARDLASVEKDPAKWEDRFYTALEDFKFLCYMRGICLLLIVLYLSAIEY